MAEKKKKKKKKKKRYFKLGRAERASIERVLDRNGSAKSMAKRFPMKG